MAAGFSWLRPAGVPVNRLDSGSAIQPWDSASRREERALAARSLQEGFETTIIYLIFDDFQNNLYHNTSSIVQQIHNIYNICYHLILDI